MKSMSYKSIVFETKKQSSHSRPHVTHSQTTVTLSPEDFDYSMYRWLESLPLVHNNKKNLARNFSDGRMCAQIVRLYLPRFVDLHNYQPYSSIKNKLANWSVLNWKVFRKLKCPLSAKLIEDVCKSVKGAAEKVLQKLKPVLERESEKQSASLVTIKEAAGDAVPAVMEPPAKPKTLEEYNEIISFVLDENDWLRLENERLQADINSVTNKKQECMDDLKIQNQELRDEDPQMTSNADLPDLNPGTLLMDDQYMKSMLAIVEGKEKMLTQVRHVRQLLVNFMTELDEQEEAVKLEVAKTRIKKLI